MCLGFPQPPARAEISGHLLFAPKEGKSSTVPVGGKTLDGAAAKVLWLIPEAESGEPLKLTGTNLTDGQTVNDSFPSAGNGEYPSIIHLPSKECWRLELQAGAIKGTVTLMADGE